MKDNLALAVLFLVCFTIFAYLLVDEIRNTPIVLWSHSEDRCVSATLRGENISCDEVGERYERIWVK